jgi:alpha-D-ribose 1-methylphosphonate 5-triphosphate synthase subunit PhnH
MILQALSPGNIIRLNQINILTPFSAGTTITLGTVATPGLVLSLVDPAVDAYLSPEFHEVTVPDFLILNASPSGLSGSGRLLYGVQP